MKAIQRQYKDKEVGKCPICGINTYGSNKTEYNGAIINGVPIVWPCGVSGPQPTGQKIGKDARFQCPWETVQRQNRINVDAAKLVLGMRKGIED